MIRMLCLRLDKQIQEAVDINGGNKIKKRKKERKKERKKMAKM